MMIRNAEEDDIEKIGVIYAKAFAYTDERIIQYFQGFKEYIEFCMRQNYAFVAEDDKVCGVILGYEKPDMVRGKILYIELLAILPEYQGKGYGKALINKLEEIAAGNGINELSLRTGCYMEAFHFYCHLGFKDTRDDQRYMVRRIAEL